MQAWLEAFFTYSENWGKVWFGLVFWGSVLGASLLALFPSMNPTVAYGGASAGGAVVGLIAKARGRWV
jgi:hypothetical protein